MFRSTTAFKGCATVAVTLIMTAPAWGQFEECPNPKGGDCFEATAGIGGCTDEECCNLVCDADPACCILEWDAICVQLAIGLCSGGGCEDCGGLGCSDCFVGGGAFCNDQCDGEPCVGCCATVCAIDPYCCDVDWDGFCVDEAGDFCTCEEDQVPDNNDCKTAPTVDIGLTAMSNDCATSDGPSHAGNCDDAFGGFGADIWFIYSAGFSGGLTVNPLADDPGSWITQLAIYEGTDCENLPDPPFACADLGGGVTIAVSAGTDYLIRVGGAYNGPVGAGNLEIISADIPDACVDGVGNCIDGHGGLGCEVPGCCIEICEADPTCCEVEWDETCAALAAEMCDALPCDLDVSPATYNEVEQCGEDTNGGCNSDPAVFEDIGTGGIIAGTVWADGGTRDTDWYTLTLDPAADVDGDGLVDVHSSILGELQANTFIILDPNGDCSDTPVVATGAAQSCIGLSSAVFSVSLDDIVYIWVGTADENGGTIFDGYPCKGDDFGNKYLVCVEVTDDGVAATEDCPPKGGGDCPWDLDGSGDTGTNDLILLLGSWGDPYDTADLIELLGAWGPCP